VMVQCHSAAKRASTTSIWVEEDVDAVGGEGGMRRRTWECAAIGGCESGRSIDCIYNSRGGGSVTEFATPKLRESASERGRQGTSARMLVEEKGTVRGVSRFDNNRGGEAD
jgi:hypothetical protein